MFSSAPVPLRVLVNGGAAGIGLACAEVFAASGAELILCDIDGDALTAAANRLGAYSRFCDSIAETSVAIFAADVAMEFSSIDVLINAAGRGYVRSLAMSRMTRAMFPMLRGSGGIPRFVFNLVPAGGFAAKGEIFPYASSIEGFERLHESLLDLARGTSIEMARVHPRLLRSEPSSDRPARYELNRADKAGTAKALVERVAAARNIDPCLKQALGRRA